MKRLGQIKTWLGAGLLLAVVVLMAAKDNPEPEPVPPAYGPESGLSEILVALGDDKPLHYTTKRDAELVARGRDLVTKGRAIGPNGKMGKLQSKYFVCTSCHNQAIEDPDLRYSDPQKRLDYVVEKNMPLLQGTTFYGMVNRETWYNDDYLKKYGDLVASSRDTLINAINLCCTECSQGRLYKDWELEAVMAYLYSLEYKLGDLKLTDEQYKMLDDLINNNGAQKDKNDAIRWFKQQYFTASPATFMNPQGLDSRKLGEGGNAENGKKVYQHSCQHCHKPGGVTNYELDNSKITFKSLRNHLKKHGHYSVYEISRKGTYAQPGYRPYMPLYTKERMSDEMMEDLIAFIQQQAK